jgi:hypothetical protein
MASIDWENIDQREPLASCKRCGAIVMAKRKKVHITHHDKQDKIITSIHTVLGQLSGLSAALNNWVRTPQDQIPF